MSIDSALHRFRNRQAEQFSDACTVQRPVGEPEFDTDTETYTQDVVSVYVGVCKLRPVAIRGDDEANAGETLVATPDSECKFPVDTDIQRGDILTITASLYDAGMVGKTFTVGRVPSDAWQIARIAVVQETIPPLLNEVS